MERDWRGFVLEAFVLRCWDRRLKLTEENVIAACVKCWCVWVKSACKYDLFACWCFISIRTFHCVSIWQVACAIMVVIKIWGRTRVHHRGRISQWRLARSNLNSLIALTNSPIITHYLFYSQIILRRRYYVFIVWALILSVFIIAVLKNPQTPFPISWSLGKSTGSHIKISWSHENHFQMIACPWKIMLRLV